VRTAYQTTYTVAPGVGLVVTGEADVEEIRNGYGQPSADVDFVSMVIEYDGSDVTALVENMGAFHIDRINELAREAARLNCESENTGGW